MSWKRTLVFAGIALLVLGAGTGIAQAPSGQADGATRIAVINSSTVIEQSTIGQEARSRIESAMNDWQERLTAKQQEIESLEQQRRDGALTLSDQALQDLQTQIENATVELQRMRDDARREVRRLEQQVLANMNEQLSPLLQQLAAEGGYDLILDASNMQGMLFYAGRIDVTERFLTMVNEANPSLGGSGQQGQESGSRR